MKVDRSVLLLLLPLLLASRDSYAKKRLDPYKILGVDREASQRDIQKAFHKLSLQYHPDKNKDKGAEGKFAEINNAYDILSDEKKRKNYDLYGDEKAEGFDGGANFGGENFGGHGGYSFFTSGGSGSNQHDFKPGGGNSFSFSFGGNPDGGSPFEFDVGNIFSNLFGGQSGSGGPFGSFRSSGGSKSGSTSTKKLRSVDAKVYNKEIQDQGLTWLFLFFTPSSRGNDMMEAIVEEVSNSLQGAIKAGSVNCLSEKTLCDEFGVRISRSARIFVYSYSAGGVQLIEYNDELDARDLKGFCTEYLPRFSKRVNIRNFEFSSNKAMLPQVLLLSTKRDTPVVWRALSGLYRNRFVLYDSEVQNIADQKIRSLGVDTLPAIVGRMANGEILVLKNGVTIKDLKTGVSELGTLLEDFEKKNKKAAARQSPTDSWGEIPHLSSSNMDDLCGERSTLCIIGAFRSSKGKHRIESMLSHVSQMTLTRRPSQARYVLVDSSKQPSFLKSFDGSSFKKSDLVLVAYKPRKGKYAALAGDNAMTLEEVEVFVSSALNGDLRFSKVLQKPMVR